MRIVAEPVESTSAFFVRMLDEWLGENRGSNVSDSEDRYIEIRTHHIVVRSGTGHLHESAGFEDAVKVYEHENDEGC